MYVPQIAKIWKSNIQGQRVSFHVKQYTENLN
jgi:hypothetical protein